VEARRADLKASRGQSKAVRTLKDAVHRKKVIPGWEDSVKVGVLAGLMVVII
jgi:hypothetical protein